jgi:hypothetical protein
MCSTAALWSVASASATDTISSIVRDWQSLGCAVSYILEVQYNTTYVQRWQMVKTCSSTFGMHLRHCHTSPSAPRGSGRHARVVG